MLRDEADYIYRDILLSFPIGVLSLLYWYTRQTTAGLHSSAMTVIASVIFFEEVYFVYYGGRSKTVSWEMYVFVIAFSGLDLFEAIMMIKLVLPFEVIWGDWLPKGFRRTGWTKRERDTRRQERKVNWVQRGIVSLSYPSLLSVRTKLTTIQIAAGLTALLAVFNHYDLYLVDPLHRLPAEHTDTEMSTTVSSLSGAFKLTAFTLQLLLNKHSSTFAGQYAIHAYLTILRRGVRLLKFWPWFVGRYEVRGGIAWTTVLWIAADIWAAWQALTLPRVEQVVKEDEEDE